MGVVYRLIMAHEENELIDPPDYYKPYLSKCGKIFGLDFCIGNKKYRGIGIAAQTTIAFMDYFLGMMEPNADTFLIDLFTDNPQTIHLYQKTGFQIKCAFMQERGYVD